MNILSLIIKFILGLFKSAPAPTTQVSASCVVDCVATCFGYKDSGDNGVGAWGDNNGELTSTGVSVPIPILKESLGLLTKSVVKAHRVKVKANGKICSFEITDLGPGIHGCLIWEKDTNLGHLLDLTYGACKALGFNYDANKGSFKVSYWIEEKATGKQVAIKGLDAPKHYV